MNELLVILEIVRWRAIAYVDDVVLIISGRFVGIIRDRMQLAIGKVREWASGRGLGINPGKMEVVFFTRKYTFSSTEIV